MKLFKWNKPCKLKVGKKWGVGKLCTFPVSYRYNGGIVVNGEWHKGVEVGPPEVPEGFILKDIAVGLNLNCFPPLATQLLIKEV